MQDIRVDNNMFNDNMDLDDDDNMNVDDKFITRNKIFYLS